MRFVTYDNLMDVAASMRDRFAAKADVPVKSSTTPRANGAAAVGSESSYAAGDHVHPTDTTRAAASDLTAHTGDTTVHVTAAERASWNAKTSNTGTVTKVSTGAGLTGGDVTTTGTIKASLKSETRSALTAAAMGSTSSRQYAVGLDANGNLSVNVPWADTDTTYSSMTASEMQAGSSTTGRLVTPAVLKSAFAQWCDDDTIKVNSSGKLYVALPNLDGVGY